MNEHGCVKIKPHLQKQVMGQIWPVVYSFLSPGFSSVQFSHSVVSDSLRPHESQHATPPCPSPTPRVHSDSRPSSQWCHPAISSSVVPFSSFPQSLPASESFPVSQNTYSCSNSPSNVKCLCETNRIESIDFYVIY